MSIPERSRRRPGSQAIEDMRGQTPEDFFSFTPDTTYDRASYCRGHNTSGISFVGVGNNSNPLTMNAVDSDVDNYIRDSSTYKMYVPQTGYYLVWGGGRWYNNTAEFCITVHHVSAAGADTTIAHDWGYANDSYYGQVYSIYRATAGDYFYINLIISISGGTMSRNDDSSPEAGIALLGVDSNFQNF